MSGSTVRAGHDRRPESTFARTEIVDEYVARTTLMECERYVFERHIGPGLRILDLGVGAGRTTGHLAPGASRYVGVDLSDAMIAACRAAFPGLAFVCGDASDLTSIAGDGSFDAVVFSFNGIDCLPDDEARRACLGEVGRVLAPDGVFIFSTHNPFVLVRRTGPLSLARWKLSVARIARAVGRSVVHTATLLRTPRLWRGEGYYLDSAHGGIRLHAADRRRVAAEVEQSGFDVIEVIGSDHPRPPRWWITPFYYYVVRPRALTWPSSMTGDGIET